MTIDEFKNSLHDEHPPKEISPLLLALWYDAKGDWESSHNIAQDIDALEGAMIHAYLHRKEGDISNADYWYNCAGMKRFNGPLEDEWNTLFQRFLMYPNPF